MASKTDTIVLKAIDYELLKSDDNIFDIRLLNKVDEIRDKQNVIISIEIGDRQYIAKGNKLTSSAVPVDCDLFYPIDKNSLPIIIDNKMTLRKLMK